MKFKEYEMPDGKKAVFEYDENGVGKITLECMDMLMGLINDRKTENCSEIPNNCANCKHLKKHNGNLADWVCDRKGSIVTNPYDKECDEMWEPKDEPQTERSSDAE